MSDRTRIRKEEAAVPAAARVLAAQDGVPLEIADRRRIGYFALFAMDEPERPQGTVEDAVEGTGGIVAFLPDACSAPSRRR